MKKLFLNETEKRKLISKKEQMIIESFANNFNKIKRVDEDEVKLGEEKSLETENAEASLEKSIMQGIKSSVKENESDCIQHYYNNPHELGPGETPEGKCRNF
jgi:hypothetical protein